MIYGGGGGLPLDRQGQLWSPSYSQSRGRHPHQVWGPQVMEQVLELAVVGGGWWGAVPGSAGPVRVPKLLTIQGQ